jgi:hypothetical protein
MTAVRTVIATSPTASAMEEIRARGMGSRTDIQHNMLSPHSFIHQSLMFVKKRTPSVAKKRTVSEWRSPSSCMSNRHFPSVPSFCVHRLVLWESRWIGATP